MILSIFIMLFSFSPIIHSMNSSENGVVDLGVNSDLDLQEKAFIRSLYYCKIFYPVPFHYGDEEFQKALTKMIRDANLPDKKNTVGLSEIFSKPLNMDGVICSCCKRLVRSAGCAKNVCLIRKGWD